MATPPSTPKAASRANDRPAIRIKDLTKRYGEFAAIDSVSIDIATGEFFMIVGPSGCGKTTLLRILAGLDTSKPPSTQLPSIPSIRWCSKAIQSFLG
jgi:ABC-type multidrug transport system ATPase subunit